MFRKIGLSNLISLILLSICLYLLKINNDLNSWIDHHYATIDPSGSDSEFDPLGGDTFTTPSPMHNNGRRGLKGKHDRLPWTNEDRRKAIKSMERYPSVTGDLPTMDKRLCESNTTCLEMSGNHKDVPSDVGGCIYRESQKSILVNGKILSYYDIAKATEMIRDFRGAYSTTNYMGVALQQDPGDAFAISDLLWRVKPRLLIELGTSGGGSALFWARSMRVYDPYAHVITIDPANGPDYLDGVPLRNWNWENIQKFCPHCMPAKNSSLWAHHVTFLRKLPTSKEALDYVKKKVDAVTSQGLPVMIIEDSNHLYSSVSPNINAYFSFVTPGSYFIVQDIRGGAFDWSKFGPCKAVNDFMQKQDYRSVVDRSKVPVYVRDRRPEVFIYSQHSGGFLRRLENFETPVAFYDELL